MADSSNPGTGAVAEKPNRLTYKMSWADDEATLVAPSALFEWNTVPTIDAYNVTNGDPAFDPDTEKRIYARYLQIEITLRSDGLES